MTTAAELTESGQVPLDATGSWWVEGDRWTWEITVTDAAGDGVDLTGASFSCKVADAVDGTTLVTFTVTGDATGLISGVATATTGTASRALHGSHGRMAMWSCTMTAGGNTIHLWPPVGVLIKPSLGV